MFRHALGKTEFFRPDATFSEVSGVNRSDGLFWPARAVVTSLMGRDQTREEFERFVASSAGDLLWTGYMVVWGLPEAEDLVQECLFQIARGGLASVRWSIPVPMPGGYSSIWHSMAPSGDGVIVPSSIFGITFLRKNHTTSRRRQPLKRWKRRPG